MNVFLGIRAAKIEIFTVKVIPIILAVFSYISIALTYYDIDITIINLLFGISLFSVLPLYTASKALKFCNYHLYVIYYLMVNNIVYLLDYLFLLPISNYELFKLYTLIAFSYSLVVIKLYIENKKKKYE